MNRGYRRTRWVTSILLALMVICACTGGVGAAKRVLRVMDWKVNETPQTQAWFQYAKERFENLHPGLEVQLETVGWGTGYRDRIAVQSAAGDPPDVAALSIVWALDLYRQGALSSLNQYLAQTPQLQVNKFFPTAAMYTSYQGVYFGVPHELGAAAILYDIDAFEQSGLNPDPMAITDWTGFLGACRRLQREDAEGTVKRYAYSFGLYPESFGSWFNANGGLFYTEDLQRTAFNNPQGIETLEYLIELKDYNFFGGDMAGGTAAMMQGGNWVPYFLRAQAPKMRFQLMSFPKGPSGSARGGMVWTNMVSIPAGSDEADLAWEWITYYAGQEGAAEFFKAIGTASSPRLDFYRSSAWLSQLKDEPWRAMIAEIAQVSGIYAFIRYEDMIGTVWPVTLNRAWAKEISAQEALAKAEEQYNRLLAPAR